MELIVTIAIFAVIAAILVPTLLGFTKSARITSANRTASELKKSIAYFLTKADAYSKNYMRISEGSSEVFTVTVTGGVWTVNAVEHPDAFSPDTVTWGHDATVDENTSEVGSTYGEELLGIYLRKSLSTLKNGTLQANCVQGVCLSVWYSADGTPGEIHDLPTFGATDAWVDDEGNPTDTHHWNGTAGVNSDGMTIGTAPALSIA
ncbi:prepilin-type cleavage/methylation N-terminal domain protein [[Eubacterium] siraeum CAG:80]|uniref:Prepilin-type cleavage/methylation N-terminal domain protein n=1 Tax=[Eubacterium] siraeum CAG:80 TaxID=1263080 RepID=R6SAT3_9FIRM|nr:prepilin-type cleavage/methylation N-terminal domain protein [[Eubacterium] siraeum CAG:80]